MTTKYGLDENSSNRGKITKVNNSNKLNNLEEAHWRQDTLAIKLSFWQRSEDGHPIGVKTKRKIGLLPENHPDKSASGTARHIIVPDIVITKIHVLKAIILEHADKITIY